MRPPLPDLSVYLVTDPGARHGVVDTAVAAARGGATIVQLRDKTASERDIAGLGRALIAALAPFNVPLIVNDRVDVAVEIGAAGAHIGQGDLSVAEARKRLGSSAILGLSIETEAQMDRPDWRLIDYIGASPYRATITKPDHAAPVGPAGLSAICAAAPCPVVAIGGIMAADAPELKGCGASGMAVVSAICAAEDPERAARTLAEAWRVA